jgi:putative phosphoesterase
VILGLLSDTHGRYERTAVAIALLERLGAEAFVHCGDVGGEAVFEQFAGRRAWFVWGNTDFPSAALERYVESLGLTLPPVSPLQIEIDGREIAVYHGQERHFHHIIRKIQDHDLAAFRKLTGGVDYIIHGHTHRASHVRIDHVQLINPGALERARPHTVATLDVAHDALEFWHVDEHAATGDPPRPFLPR